MDPRSAGTAGGRVVGHIWAGCAGARGAGGRAGGVARRGPPAPLPVAAGPAGAGAVPATSSPNLASAGPTEVGGGIGGGVGGQVDSEVYKAIRALRTGTLYVAPGPSGGSGAPGDAVDAAALRQALDGASRVVVAVLPPAAATEAGGGVDGLPGLIAAGLNRAGTVLVLAGNRVALASVGDSQAVLADAVDSAQSALDQGPATRAHVTAVLARLVREARQAPSAFPRTSERAPSRAGAPTAWTGYVGLLLVLAAAGAAVAWLLRRGRRRRPASPPHRRVHVDAAGRLISVEDVGRAR